jgi:hypothetical protein
MMASGSCGWCTWDVRHTRRVSERVWMQRCMAADRAGSVCVCGGGGCSTTCDDPHARHAATGANNTAALRVRRRALAAAASAQLVCVCKHTSAAG